MVNTPTVTMPPRTSTLGQQGSLPIMGLATLALLSAVAPLATDMYLPALPQMADELGATVASAQLTLTTFLVGLACGQLFIGPLSDQFGRRTPLLMGTGACVASGLLCMAAPNIAFLVAMRFVQGFSGAAGIVLARAIIVDRSTSAIETARYFQIMMSISALAPILAPIIGVGILTVTRWRGVFVVLAVLSALAFVGTVFLLKESLPNERRSPAGLGALFNNVAKVIKNNRYLGYALTTGSAFMVLFSYIASSPFVLQNVMGLSPLTYAVVFGINSIGLTSSSVISARIVRRVGPRRLATIGLISMGTFTGLLVLSTVFKAPIWTCLLALFGAVTSVGYTMGNSSALAISEVPDAAGAGSAVLGALQFGLGALASYVVGLGGKDSAVPMAAVMFTTAVLAALCFSTTSKQRNV